MIRIQIQTQTEIICCFTLQISRSQDLHLHLPCRWQGPKYLTFHRPFATFQRHRTQTWSVQYGMQASEEVAGTLWQLPIFNFRCSSQRAWQQKLGFSITFVECPLYFKCFTLINLFHSTPITQMREPNQDNLPQSRELVTDRAALWIQGC